MANPPAAPEVDDVEADVAPAVQPTTSASQAAPRTRPFGPIRPEGEGV